MKHETLKLPDRFWMRTTLFLLGIGMLAAVYLLQQINPAASFADFHPNVIFVINRTVRLIVNDVACLLVILAIFMEAKHMKIAFWLFLLELLIVLPLYLGIKLTLEGHSEISSPLLSQVHRLIVNPLLMILLIAGFFYQRFSRGYSGL